MNCRNCGSELREGAVFCTNCGAKQETQATEPVVEDLDKTVGLFGVDEGRTPTEQVNTQPVSPMNTMPNQAPAYQQQNTMPNQQYNTVPNQGAWATPNQQQYTPPTQTLNGQPYNQQPVYNNQFNAAAGGFNSPNPTYNDVVMKDGAPHVGVSFFEAIKLFFKNYVNFSGRSSKSEYWWVFLFNIIISIPQYFIAAVLPPLSGLISIALMIPGLALSIRRLHDIGKSGTYILMGLIPLAGPIILLVYMCKESDGDNPWGYGPYHQ